MRIIKKILLNSKKSLKNDYYKYNLKASQDNYIKTDAGSNIEKNILLENHEKQKKKKLLGKSIIRIFLITK